MKLAHVLGGFGFFAILCFFVVHFSSQHIVGNDTRQHLQAEGDQLHMKSLVELVNIQSETIRTLEAHLKQMVSKSGDKSAEDAKLIEISDTISKLTRESEQNRQKAAQCYNMSQEIEHNFDIQVQQLKLSSLTQAHCPEQPVAAVATTTAPVSPSAESRRYVEPRTKLEEQCEQRYGMELVDTWRKNEQIWCASGDQDPKLKSELKCYPYHQAHKKLDRRGPDLVCEATNFVIDFDKVSSLCFGCVLDEQPHLQIF